MPTQKPRIMVTVSRPVYETISRMAKLSKQSKSSIVGELLETVHPPLMRTVALLEAASEAPRQVREGLRDTIAALEREAQATADLQVVQMDWLHQAMQPPPPAHGEAPASERGRRKPRSTPVPVTRGSGTPKKRKKGK